MSTRLQQLLDEARDNAAYDQGEAAADKAMLRDEIAALDKANERLRELLGRYGNHKSGCDKNLPISILERKECTCGWEKARKEINL